MRSSIHRPAVGCLLVLLLIVLSGPPAQGEGVFYAVGSSYDSESGLLHRHVGTSWSRVAHVSIPYDVHVVWGRGAEDIYIVGAADDYFGGTLYHFDGLNLTEIALPGTPGGASRAWSVHGNAAGELVVGVSAYLDDGSAVRPTVARFDGSDWTLLPLIDVEFATHVNVAVNDAGQILVLYEEIDPQTTDFFPVAKLYDGGWVDLDSDPAEQASFGKPWTDGTAFFFAHYSLFDPELGDQTRFRIYTPGVGWDLLSWEGYCDPQDPGLLTTCYGVRGRHLDIWVDGTQDFWSCGENGWVAHYDGVSMIEKIVPDNVTLKAIWGLSPQEIRAVGQDTSFLYNGMSWQESPIPRLYHVRDIWGYADSDPVPVTVTTDPPGLRVGVDGVRWRLSPVEFESYEGLWHQVDTDSLQYPGEYPGEEIYAFSHWSDGGEQQHVVQVPGTPITYTAHFDLVPAVQVTLDSDPPGVPGDYDGEWGAFPTYPDSFVTPYSFSAAPGTWYEIGVDEYHMPPGAVYEFLHWSDGGERVHLVQIPNEDVTYTATYQDISVDVTFETAPPGFTVYVDSWGQTCPFTFTTGRGFEHSISAISSGYTPDGHYWRFLEWSDGGDRSHLITLGAQDETFVATYEDLSLFVTLDTEPPGLLVTHRSEDHVAPYTFISYPGNIETISAPSPQLVDDRYYVFDRWSDSDYNYHKVIIQTYNTEFTAFFEERVPATLTVLSEPPGHTLQVGDDWVTTPHAVEVASGELVHLDAPTPPVWLQSELYYFDHWSDGGAPEHDVLVPEGGVTCTASYGVVQGIDVTVDTVPSGLWINVAYYDAVTGNYVYQTTSSPHSVVAVEGQPMRLYTISPQEFEGTTYYFGSWSDGGDIVHTLDLPFHDVVYTGYFYSELDLTVTVTTEPAGLEATLDDLTGTGTLIVPSAQGVPHEIGVETPQYLEGIRHDFLWWSDGGDIVHSITTPESSVVHTASFLPIDKTVSLVTDPAGGVVTVDGVEQDSPYSFLAGTGRTHEIGAAPTLRHKGTDYVFASWSDGGERVHEVVIPDGNVTYTAYYEDPTAVDEPAERLVNALAQNHPNPFNPSTTVRFSLEKAGHARLVIYDAAGRPVRTLLDREMEAGSQTVLWDGRDDAGHEVASGVLYYRLQAEGYVETRKMVLLR